MSWTKIGDFTSAESWTTICDVILGTQTGNPIWRKERNRRQEEGDIALLGPVTVEVVKFTRKKGFPTH